MKLQPDTRRGDDALPSGTSVAEASRPHRAVRAQAKEARGLARASRKRTADQATGGGKEPVLTKRTQARTTDWHTPFLWVHINEAAKHVGPGMSPRSIVTHLHQKHRATGLFEGLKEQVVGRMIDRTGEYARWTDETMRRVRRGRGAKGNVTRAGILVSVDPHPSEDTDSLASPQTNHPAAYNSIIAQLKALRNAAVRITASVARAVMVATLRELAPEVFSVKTKLGRFQCSIQWVRRFLRVHLRWSMRRATRAAQKIPLNAQEQCRASFCRHALAIRDYGIPAELIVNIDQAQVVLQDTSGRTYETTGSGQVSVIGLEEKRAFTVLAGVSSNGAALPFQVIWKGKTGASLPSASSPGYAEAVKLGIRFEYSNTDTYWSTYETMCSYVTNILVPYFMSIKIKLKLSPDHECILLLDVWSVHRSERFRAWMKKTYPWIIMSFVPGGCTGIWQPCDVGIQRLMKLAIRRAQHEDVVSEVQAQLKKGTAPGEMKIATGLPVLRSRSVQWLVNAYNAVNDEAIVKKVRDVLASELLALVDISQAWSGCRLSADRDLNLSYESLTSRKARQLLQHVEQEEPDLWRELKPSQAEESLLQANCMEEAPYPSESAFADYPDPTVPLSVIKKHICDEEISSQYNVRDDGTVANAEDHALLDEDWSDASDDEYDPPTDDESFSSADTPKAKRMKTT